MKVLVVGREPRTHSLLEGLLCSPLWSVTHCATVEDARRELDTVGSGQAFDYILVEPDEQGRFDNDVTPLDPAPPSKAPVVYVDWRGDQLPTRRDEGVYGLYPVGVDVDDGHASGDGQWVFEYHAPCRQSTR